MSDDVILIGNVRFYKDDVASSSTSRTADGSKLYSVFLKNGTKVHFYDQGVGSNASVMAGFDMGTKQEGTAFAGIMGMVIEGSDKDDYYHVLNCDYYEVNIEGGGKDEVRVVNTNGGKQQSANVNRDINDNAYTVDTSNGISRSEGWFIRKKKQ